MACQDPWDVEECATTKLKALTPYGPTPYDFEAESLNPPMDLLPSVLDTGAPKA